MQDVQFRMLCASELDPVFWTPERLDKPSTFWGHIPFAFWITAACKPRVLVETGTHQGVSYAAFCEAVVRSDLSTRCYAIDPWSSNIEAGVFGNEIYEELKDFHDRRYASFSKMLRVNWNAACQSFEDETVDVLHFGGYHTYETAQLGFESWLPKLSKQAVVLFHDTQMKKSEGGVRRFFDELKLKFPSFEFSHSFGLGVIAVGVQAPSAIKELCGLRGNTHITAVQDRFAHIGARWVAVASETSAKKSIRQLSAEVQQRDLSIADKNAQIAEYLYHLNRINSSFWWRLGKTLEALILAPLRLVPMFVSLKDSAAERFFSPDRSYQKWIELYDTLSVNDRSEIRNHIVSLKFQPLISIVMPAFNTPEKVFREAIESARSQLYENWELCVSDDASSSPAVAAILEEISSYDQRIKWIRRDSNGNICKASNSALKLAAGEFIALMDHDDVLAETALYEVVVELNASPDADLIYSDEDRIDDEGKRHSPYFKTDWNPELFLGQNMVCHLSVLRRSVLEKAGGFRVGFEGAQDYDLVLRVINIIQPDKIRHIAAVLYHWRDATQAASFSKSQLERCVGAARRAKEEYFSYRGEVVEIIPNPASNNHERIFRPLPIPAPLVSLIVPTRNRHDLLAPCIDGLLNRTNYTPIEVLVVDHGSDDSDTIALLDRLRADERVQIIPYDGPFNYSDMNNTAVARARGAVIGLINNDIDVIEPNWLEEMVALAIMPEYGAIGAKLLYPDDRVQHGGVILGSGGIASHAHLHADRCDRGHFDRLVMTSNVSAVTGACLIIRKELFDEVGGLNAEDLPVAFSDVDLCLKIRAKGYLNVWTPFALLYHHESPSRGSDTSPEKLERARREIEYMRRRWDSQLDCDPYFNVNLSLENTAFDLSFPPRRIKPWRSE